MCEEFNMLMNKMHNNMIEKGVGKETIDKIIKSCYDIKRSLENIKYETRYIDVAKTFKLVAYTLDDIRQYSDITISSKDFSELIPHNMNDGIPITVKQFFIESVDSLLL